MYEKNLTFIDRIGFWIADRIGTVLTIEFAVAFVLIIYGLFWGGFAMKGH